MRHLPDKNCQHPSVKRWPGEALPTHLPDDRVPEISRQRTSSPWLCFSARRSRIPSWPCWKDDLSSVRVTADNQPRQDVSSVRLSRLVLSGFQVLGELWNRNRCKNTYERDNDHQFMRLDSFRSAQRTIRCVTSSRFHAKDASPEPRLLELAMVLIRSRRPDCCAACAG